MKIETKIEQLSIDELNVDYHYQRPTNLKRLKNKNKGAKFDLGLFGVVTVSRRANGTHWIIDGATRTEWAEEEGYDKVPCVVKEGLTVAGEARLFRKLNEGRVGVKGNEKFKSALCEKDKVAILVATLAKLTGWTIVDKNIGPGQLEIAYSLMQYLQPKAKDTFSEEIIKVSLDVAFKAWGNQKEGGQLRAIRPIMVFLKQGQAHKMSIATMAERLNLVCARMTALDLVNSTKNKKGNCYNAGARFLAEAYNLKLSEANRFPIGL